jgi:hypothetical protein
VIPHGHTGRLRGCFAEVVRKSINECNERNPGKDVGIQVIKACVDKLRNLYDQLHVCRNHGDYPPYVGDLIWEDGALKDNVLYRFSPEHGKLMPVPYPEGYSG